MEFKSLKYSFLRFLYLCSIGGFSSINLAFSYFICLKEGKIFFVEVKSNGSGLNINQKITMPNLIKKGFEVKVKNVVLDFSCKDIKDIDVQELINRKDQHNLDEGVEIN